MARFFNYQLSLLLYRDHCFIHRLVSLAGVTVPVGVCKHLHITAIGVYRLVSFTVLSNVNSVSLSRDSHSASLTRKITDQQLHCTMQNTMAEYGCRIDFVQNEPVVCQMGHYTQFSTQFSILLHTLQNVFVILAMCFCDFRKTAIHSLHQKIQTYSACRRLSVANRNCRVKLKISLATRNIGFLPTRRVMRAVHCSLRRSP